MCNNAERGQKRDMNSPNTSFYSIVLYNSLCFPSFAVNLSFGQQKQKKYEILFEITANAYLVYQVPNSSCTPLNQINFAVCTQK